TLEIVDPDPAPPLLKDTLVFQSDGQSVRILFPIIISLLEAEDLCCQLSHPARSPLFCRWLHQASFPVSPCQKTVILFDSSFYCGSGADTFFFKLFFPFFLFLPALADFFFLCPCFRFHHHFFSLMAFSFLFLIFQLLSEDVYPLR